jgi:hypothetical protein
MAAVDAAVAAVVAAAERLAATVDAQGDANWLREEKLLWLLPFPACARTLKYSFIKLKLNFIVFSV